MEISNFTDNNIRLGEFPFCIDVRNIPENHSSYGLLCNVYTHSYPEPANKPRIMLIQNTDIKNQIHLIVLRYDDQFEKLPDEIKNGAVLFDSIDMKGSAND